MKNISIIIPILNEEENIKILVNRICSVMKREEITYEIIFIDDGSTDNTHKVISLLKNFFPISYFKKQGKKGKAYSLYEGFQKAQYDMLAMIDADLQYPPEAIPQMIEKIVGSLSVDLQNADVVVAKRKFVGKAKTRRLISNSFRFIFGKLLFGFDHDIQAGLKVFRREVFETVKFIPKSGWTFDLEFLHRSREAGYKIVNHELDFEKRAKGNSKISFVKTSVEIGLHALSLKTKSIQPQHIIPESSESMYGAGVGYKKKKYITHTTLNHRNSALQTFLLRQRTFIAMALAAIVAGIFLKPLFTLQIIIAIFSVIYFLDVLFNLFIILKSLHNTPEIASSDQEIAVLQDKDLPIYSILCPLYKEAHVIPHFLKSISRLDWPKEKLEVMLLLEEDDNTSIEVVKKMELPKYVHVVIVPESMPKTKPKACNYGLVHAKGEYLVIYDAEDMPDPLQLKKAYLGFQKADKNVLCLQAKLNYYNPNQNLLTRFFTAEYSLWFDVTLTGLQSINTSIPLGGTSNHFRTKDLQILEGWDPFNVTEDADLGIRLFKRGYKTAMIDSTTLEEANSRLGNWVRQRSRWIKGYMQTYLVHTREFFGFRNTNPVHSLYFHLTIGGKIAFILINPILWLATIAYFTLYAIVGPTIESLYPPAIFYMAATSLVIGNFLFIYYYMVGLAKKDQWNLVKFVFLVPIYWLMISVGGFIALVQLIFKPHYWEKTIHGLHLPISTGKRKNIILEEEVTVAGIQNAKEVKKLLPAKMTSGAFLIIAAFIANFVNFLFNAFLSRKVTVEEFGLVTLIGTFQFLGTIPIGAISQTVSYRSAYILGKSGYVARDFWLFVRKYALVISIIASILWAVSIPFITKYFYTQALDPFIAFAPIWIASTLSAVDRGFLTGTLAFASIAILTLIEPISKFFVAYELVKIGYGRLVYLSIPVSVLITAISAYIFAIAIKSQKIKIEKLGKSYLKFPSKFFVASVFTKVSGVAFLSFDIILANHFLSRLQSGEYALLSLVGKMIFYVGTLFSQFITPLVSRDEGAKKNSKRTFYILFLVSIFASSLTYLVIGFFGYISVPILLGAKSHAIVSFLPLYGLAILGFTITNSIVTFYQIRGKNIFPALSIVFAGLEVFSIALFHNGIGQIVLTMAIVSAISFALTFVLHLTYGIVESTLRNLQDFLSLLEYDPLRKNQNKNTFNILVFNWRDTKHVWAGGAEAYIFELSKQWVKDGHFVTIFCGNDGKNPRNEVIENVQIVRRGGFYTVYLWAALYYYLKFRGRYDVVIDSENGIPFFTPLYVKEPVLLLVHHVHQEVFQKHLYFPFSLIAQIIESKLMPLFYRNKTVITVSESSKEDILKLNLGTKDSINVINPGIEIGDFIQVKKTENPSFLYLGRLKPYKNIDVAIKAFARIVQVYPNARYYIAGFGESLKNLQSLVEKIGLTNEIKFLGRVSENQKKLLLSQSWALLQPSLIEGWGITVIEANASGTPVIASDVGGLNASIVNGHTGLLVPAKDIGAFASAMIFLILNVRTRLTYSANAQKWARQFSWEKSARQFLQIFHMKLKDSFYSTRLNSAQIIGG